MTPATWIAICGIMVNVVFAIIMFLMQRATKATDSRIDGIASEVIRGNAEMKSSIESSFLKFEKKIDTLQTKEICAIFRGQEKAELDSVKNDVNNLGKKIDSIKD